MVGLGLTEDGTCETSSSESQESLKQIRTLLAPFVLRRMKTQVLKQLAPKTSHDIALVPNMKQKLIYDGILKRHIERVRSRKAPKKAGLKYPYIIFVCLVFMFFSPSMFFEKQFPLID